ncbi:MAG: hypothetical protein A4E65_01064 [Syntrophorhabdus sp. PtaU1.Bin153]|nr:MAG: hypothetical protein A4E65_01064 [Syntrophorhabdus sp. PtaU1.Bin153]
MIMHPAVISLFVGSVLVCLMVLYSARYGATILTRWDLRSGSELQLTLERKTYLISTIMSYVFVFQLFSLFLFIFTADKLSTLFTGAMCAAGTLNVNNFGYPTMVLKVINFILGGMWLVLNHADNRAFDYPLIKKKYLLLMAIAPFVIAETIVQGAYFLNLKAHVITSCCGSLFSTEGEGIQAGLAGFPVIPMKILFYGAMGLTCLAGLYFYIKGRATGVFFSLMSIVTFGVSVAALISFISVYFYELPTHHCPFCILQGEYHYAGYPLYLALLCGAVGGTGVGTLFPFRKIESLKDAIPLIQKRLTLMTLLSYLLFTAVTTGAIIFTDFRLDGY